MPILVFCEPTEEGAVGYLHTAVCLNTWNPVTCRHDGPERQGPNAYWIKKTHVGMCLHESERNGSDDSDFFMTYWDEAAQEPKTVMFATTRGWTYPLLGSAADATPEVRAKYIAWGKAQVELANKRNRKATADKMRIERNRLRIIAADFQVPYPRLLKLRKAYQRTQFESCIKLFSQRLRSQFKLSLQAQLIKWLRGESAHRTPLSPKQLEWV
jgi:hypothetical protein